MDKNARAMKYQLLDDFKLDPRIELTRIYRDFYGQGWAPETKDNISVRLEDNSFWITAEDKADKLLLPTDFIRIYADGKVYRKYPDILPPKLIGIHKNIYELFSSARFCCELHSLDTNLICNLIYRLFLGYKQTLPSLRTSNKLSSKLNISLETLGSIPIFDNSIQVEQIFNSKKTYYSANPPQIPILIIRNHCTIIWANSLEAVQGYVEALKFIIDYTVEFEEKNRSIPVKVLIV